MMKKKWQTLWNKIKGAPARIFDRARIPWRISCEVPLRPMGQQPYYDCCCWGMRTRLPVRCWVARCQCCLAGHCTACRHPHPAIRCRDGRCDGRWKGQNLAGISTNTDSKKNLPKIDPDTRIGPIFRTTCFDSQFRTSITVSLLNSFNPNWDKSNDKNLKK